MKMTRESARHIASAILVYDTQNFEALIHKLASDGMLELSIAQLSPLVVAVRGTIVSRGETRVACLAYLATA